MCEMRGHEATSVEEQRAHWVGNGATHKPLLALDRSHLTPCTALLLPLFGRGAAVDLGNSYMHRGISQRAWEASHMPEKQRILDRKVRAYPLVRLLLPSRKVPLVHAPHCRSICMLSASYAATKEDQYYWIASIYWVAPITRCSLPQARPGRHSSVPRTLWR